MKGSTFVQYLQNYTKKSQIYISTIPSKKIVQKGDSNLHLYNTLKLYQKKESSL